MAEEPKQQEALKKGPQESPKDAGQKAEVAEAEGEKSPAKKKKKGKKRTVTEGKVCINATYNNTIVTVTESNGNVLCWASAGSCGFKGTRKATPYAASVAAETALNKARAMGLERVKVSVKGVGTGRDQALRAVSATGVSIESIADRTAIAFGGCRPRKARRV